MPSPDFILRFLQFLNKKLRILRVGRKLSEVSCVLGRSSVCMKSFLVQRALSQFRQTRERQLQRVNFSEVRLRLSLAQTLAQLTHDGPIQAPGEFLGLLLLFARKRLQQQCPMVLPVRNLQFFKERDLHI